MIAQARNAVRRACAGVDAAIAALTLVALSGLAGGCSSGNGTPTEPRSSPPQPGVAKLGYAGPSTVTRIAWGETENFPNFNAWNGETLVRLNGTGFDGCDAFRWAHMDGTEYCWTNYRQMLASNTSTDSILFMVGFKAGRELSVAQTRDVALELQDVCTANRTDGALCTILISGLPDFVGTCGAMPTNGIPALTRSVASSVASGTPGMIVGPAFSPITLADVIIDNAQSCHQNGRKRAEHAEELMAYVGAL